GVVQISLADDHRIDDQVAQATILVAPDHHDARDPDGEVLVVDTVGRGLEHGPAAQVRVDPQLDDSGLVLVPDLAAAGGPECDARSRSGEQVNGKGQFTAGHARQGSVGQSSASESSSNSSGSRSRSSDAIRSWSVACITFARTKPPISTPACSSTSIRITLPSISGAWPRCRPSNRNSLSSETASISTSSCCPRSAENFPARMPAWISFSSAARSLACWSDTRCGCMAELVPSSLDQGNTPRWSISPSSMNARSRS